MQSNEKKNAMILAARRAQSNHDVHIYQGIRAELQKL